MKPASILEKSQAANFRDKDGIPNFRKIEQVQASFSPEEIVIMVNHFLMRPVDWEKVDCGKFCPVPHPHESSVVLPREKWGKYPARPFNRTPKSKLKPNISLKDQLKKAAPVAS